MRANIFRVVCMVVGVFGPQTLPADTQGNGVIAAPTAAAYADLTNASNRILGDLRTALPQAKTIILYDAATFALIPYYASATELVRTAAANICDAEAIASPRTLTPTLDVGGAAQGLASLLQITIPSYSIQGQNLTLDNSALVGSFATAANALGYVVVNPTYLIPAASQTTLDCQRVRSNNSLADLWKFANNEAAGAKDRAESKKSLKDALDAFQKLRDTLLAQTDKGPSALGRALAVELLAHSIDPPSRIAVIDMRLDAANIDSTTKTVLWWRKTRFSANIAAHYWIFSVHGTGAQFGMTLVEPGYVNILRKDVDLKGFAVAGGGR